MTEDQRSRLARHLFPGDGKEAVALGLCGTRLGADSHVFCIHDVVEIPLAACVLRTETGVRWDVRALVPVLERGLKRGMWIFKIHSHPTGFQQFSVHDDQTDLELAAAIESILDHSPRLVSAIMMPDGTIHARIVTAKTGFAAIRKVMVIGDKCSFTGELSAKLNDDADLRTRQAFGDRTADLLRSLTVGVAGCSGTGSWIVEMLGRLGVGKLVLVDPDIVERKNLNRILNSTAADASRAARKVEILEGAVRAMGLDTVVETYATDLTCSKVVQALACCDFLFGCMDSADGRDILNRIATYYLVPLIDIGIRLDADGHGGIEQICCAVHYLIPGGSSLLSRGVITSEQVQAQALLRTHPEQYAALKKEGYIKGIAVDRPAVVSINGFAASHAVNEMLVRLHPIRRDPLEEFRYQLFSLSDGAWLRLSGGEPCKFLSRHAGRGDVKPLLGNPSLS